MTEKQYKGIAGNFLICDVQKEYAEHLLSILVKRFGMRFQFHFFSNVKKIEQFAEKAEIYIVRKYEKRGKTGRNDDIPISVGR